MLSQENQNKLNNFIKENNLEDVERKIKEIIKDVLENKVQVFEIGAFLIENKDFLLDDAIDLTIGIDQEIIQPERKEQKEKKEKLKPVEEIIEKCNLSIKDSTKIERLEEFINLFINNKYNQDQLFDYLTRQEKVGGADLNIYQAECFIAQAKKVKEKAEIEKEKVKIEKEKSKIKADEAEENIIKESKIDLTQEDIERRLRNIIRSYFKGIRTKVEVKVVLKRDQSIGGLGLNEEEAQDFIKKLEEQKSLIDEKSLQNIVMPDEKEKKEKREKIKLDKAKENQIIAKETISQFKDKEEEKEKQPKEKKDKEREAEPINKPQKIEVNFQEKPKKLKEPEPETKFEPEFKPEPQSEVNLEEEKKEEKLKEKEDKKEKEIEKEFPSSYVKPPQKKGVSLDLQSEIESQLKSQPQQKDLEKQKEEKQPEFKIDSNLEPEENIEFKNDSTIDLETEPKLKPKEKEEIKPEPEPEPEPGLETQSEEKKEEKKEKKADNILIHRPTVNQGGFQEIKKEPRTYGPIEELKTLTLVDWRRWGNPKERSQAIKDKIDLLAEESLVKKAEGIKAWKSSEINQLYLEIGAQSIDEGKSITDIIAQRKNQNKEFLTEEEFNAIVELNQQLRF